MKMKQRNRVFLNTVYHVSKASRLTTASASTSASSTTTFASRTRRSLQYIVNCIWDPLSETDQLIVSASHDLDKNAIIKNQRFFARHF